MKSTLKVKKSKIHGRGLFATKAIAEGTTLGYCKSKPVQKQGPHVLTLGTGQTVKVTCRFKYINHSAKPNVAYYDDLSVVALSDIGVGDELTHNYGEDWAE